MNIFVSYCFNDENKWIPELVIPLIEALGFSVATGQRMEGEVLLEGIEQRLSDCAGCVAFTTKRTKRRDGTYETHPWVLDELRTALDKKFKVIEVREVGVKVGGKPEGYIRLTYDPPKRDVMLVSLAGKLSEWKKTFVRVLLEPPQGDEVAFYRRATGDDVRCTYFVRKGSKWVDAQNADIQPAGSRAYLVDLAVPSREVIVQVRVDKGANGGEWRSSGEGLLGIPVKLY